MKHEATRELFAYWNALRGERTAPDRCDLDPAAIRAILPDVFMLDVAEAFPVRLAGTRVDALLDAGQRNGFLDHWQPQERRNLAAVLDAVVDGAAPIVVGAAGAPKGRPDCIFEVLFLPLRHFGKTHSRILGIITPAHPPRWFGFAPLGPLAIRSLRMLGPDELVRPAQAGAAAETRGPVRRRGEPGGPPALGRTGGAIRRAAPARPPLRLIKGGLAG